MELKLTTTELQNMVGKAIKCVSNNKLIPLTSLMSIKVSNNVLTLATTDATNYFYVSKADKVDCPDFEVCVMADLFTRLVQKTTAENITLIVEGATMKVKGNGSYTVELPMDENGNVVKFPVKFSELHDVSDNIKLSAVRTVLNVNKASLAVNMALPVLTCYYCGDSVITSDRIKICKTDIKMFEKPRLLTGSLVDLLANFSNEEIKVYVENGATVFTDELETIYAPEVEGLDSFPVNAIESLVAQEFKHKCKVSKSVVLNLLDRLSLFVSPYDKKSIRMTFTKDGLIFSSKKSSGEELVPYTMSENFKDHTCCIDIEVLRSQVVTQDCDELEVYYGSEVAIKLVNKNVTQIIALMEDESVGA